MKYGCLALSMLKMVFEIRQLDLKPLEIKEATENYFCKSTNKGATQNPNLNTKKDRSRKLDLNTSVLN